MPLVRGIVRARRVEQVVEGADEALPLLAAVLVLQSERALNRWRIAASVSRGQGR
jgi:hypothetical protein